MTLNIYQSASPHEAPAFKENIAQIIKTTLVNKGRAIMRFLSAKREPVILQRFDQQGCPYWEIHDPATGQNYHCFNKIEVLIWLENHCR